MENIIIDAGNTFNEKEYAGFFIRVLSGIFDQIIFLIYILINFIIMIILKKPQKYYFFLLQIITFLFRYIYNVFITQKHGGTLGKLILKIRIHKLNEEKIGFKESFFRYSIDFIWYLYFTIIYINILLNTSNELYNSFDTFRECSNYLRTSEPKFIIIGTIIIFSWNISEYIVLLFNKKKRGFQDYLAGTIVVNTRYFKLRENYEKSTNST
jgi:uncharacterized RDD family membrane protein YckC